MKTFHQWVIKNNEGKYLSRLYLSFEKDNHARWEDDIRAAAKLPSRFLARASKNFIRTLAPEYRTTVHRIDIVER